MFVRRLFDPPGVFLSLLAPTVQLKPDGSENGGLLTGTRFCSCLSCVGPCSFSLLLNIFFVPGGPVRWSPAERTPFRRLVFLVRPSLPTIPTLLKLSPPPLFPAGSFPPSPLLRFRRMSGVLEGKITSETGADSPVLPPSLVPRWVVFSHPALLASSPSDAVFFHAIKKVRCKDTAVSSAAPPVFEPSYFSSGRFLLIAFCFFDSALLFSKFLTFVPFSLFWGSRINSGFDVPPVLHNPSLGPFLSTFSRGKSLPLRSVDRPVAILADSFTFLLLFFFFAFPCLSVFSFCFLSPFFVPTPVFSCPADFLGGLLEGSSNRSAFVFSSPRIQSLLRCPPPAMVGIISPTPQRMRFTFVPFDFR